MKILGLKNIISAIIPRKIITEPVQSSTSKVVENVFAKTTSEKPLFCHQYYTDLLKEKRIYSGNKSLVSLHGELNGINHFFISAPYPEHMNMKFMNTNMTPREMIRKTDLEFKTLIPTTEKMNVYRCIGEKPDFFPEYNLYKKRLSIKQGDIIDMKEYSYATSDKNYANVYLVNNRGITYDIEIPAGARVSRTGYGINNEILFPRSSKFECVGTKRIQNKDNDFIDVKLKYILPQK